MKLVAFVALAACTSPPKPEPWLADEAAAFARAREQKKAVVIDLQASWSVPAIELSQTLDKLRPALDKDFVPLRIDVTNQTADVLVLLDRYKAGSTGALFVDRDGQVLRRITAIDEPSVRAAMMDAASKRAR